MAKMGRPTKYSKALADEICHRLADGVSLRTVCTDPDMPDKRTVLSWLRRGDEGEDPYIHFLTQYVRAKEEGADALADDIMEIADEARFGKIDPNAARVAGDLKKWSASKLKPKRYGDKLDVTSGGEKLPTPLLGGLTVSDPSGDINEDEKTA